MKKLAFSIGALGLASGFATAALADSMAAYRGEKIELGSVSGTAFYTVENGGYRVVATFADADGRPVRVEAVLAPGQSIVLSSPAAFGQAPAQLEITRRDDRVEVQNSPVTD
jgi:hypothetical protein